MLSPFPFAASFRERCLLRYEKIGLVSQNSLAYASVFNRRYATSRPSAILMALRRFVLAIDGTNATKTGGQDEGIARLELIKEIERSLTHGSDCVKANLKPTVENAIADRERRTPQRS